MISNRWRMCVVIGTPALRREGYWRHVRNIASQVARKVGSAPVLRLWRGCALLQEGASVEAIRELTALVESSEDDGDGSSDVILAALVALQRAHKYENSK